jgi:hypothetical protein
MFDCRLQHVSDFDGNFTVILNVNTKVYNSWNFLIRPSDCERTSMQYRYFKNLWSKCNFFNYLSSMLLGGPIVTLCCPFEMNAYETHDLEM